MYRSVLKNGQDSFIERKSQFIGYAFPVTSEEEALDKIAQIKAKNKDATHNCSAYIIGEDKLIQRYNDDGEPSGTAGIPMLEVLKRENLTNVCLVVTRYFGGILLGAGGLVRAYSHGAKIALDASHIVEMREFERLSLTYDYSFHGEITNRLIKAGYKILKETYTDKVSLEIHSELGDNSIKKELTNLTSAKIDIKVLKNERLPCNKGKIIYKS
ncbi:YigZ family protein [Peptoniphilus catoniae]|uniref:YigZ family protein n=1 Tax=Peptoniphilus catoniae TaxID=1660341 RepID=UPI0010FEB2BB|nr:YigZ family protein [Peptoniphilus catoniae]